MVEIESTCLSSANEVLVVIEVNSETIADHLETFLRQQHIRLWHSLHIAAVLHHCKLLELLHCTCGTVLLSVLDWVILLRHFETKGWVAEHDANTNKGTHDHNNLRSLILKVHSRVGIWQLIVKVLILETDTVHIVIFHVVVDSQVVMDIASAIDILWSEIESNIVPVWRHELVHW